MISNPSIVHRSLKQAGRTWLSWITVWILTSQTCCARMWLHARTHTHTHTHLPKGPYFRNTEALALKPSGTLKLSLWSLQEHWSALSEAFRNTQKHCHGVAGSPHGRLQGFGLGRPAGHRHPRFFLFFLSLKCPLYWPNPYVLQLHHIGGRQ